MKLVLASNNPGKLQEIREIMAESGIEVLSQREAGCEFEAEETGTSFDENARIKAMAAMRATGLPAAADDSGLEVDHLGGAPGVYSARYAEPGHRCERVLSELEGVPDNERTARFRCVICFIDADGKAQYVSGSCEGRIGYERRGSNGFGYDPIFLYDDRTLAEMSADEKNAISHRGKAIRELTKLL